MGEQGNSTKDIWDKLDVIFKGFAAILVSGAIAFYGIQSNARQNKIAEANRQAQIESNSRQKKIAEANRQAQVLIQTMSHRETSASNMRAQMFKTLMEHYFKEKDDKITRIAILELIGLNFQDHIHLKPLFKRLDKQLTNNNLERENLRNVAKYLKRSEMNNIVGSGGKVFECKLEKGKTNNVGPSKLIKLTLLNVEKDYIEVSTNPEVSSNPEDDRGKFEVSYYDMPFMDNSRLGELTYSILLSSIISEKTAEVNVVILPKHYYSALNNLRFDAMIGDILEKPEEKTEKSVVDE